MVAGSRGDGAVQQYKLSSKIQATINSIREIVGAHSDAEILAVLRETNMDPNETAQKLLYQGLAHLLSPRFIEVFDLSVFSHRKMSLRSIPQKLIISQFASLSELLVAVLCSGAVSATGLGILFFRMKCSVIWCRYRSVINGNMRFNATLLQKMHAYHTELAFRLILTMASLSFTMLN